MKRNLNSLEYKKSESLTSFSPSVNFVQPENEGPETKFERFQRMSDIGTPKSALPITLCP